MYILLNSHQPLQMKMDELFIKIHDKMKSTLNVITLFYLISNKLFHTLFFSLTLILVEPKRQCVCGVVLTTLLPHPLHVSVARRWNFVDVKIFLSFQSCSIILLQENIQYLFRWRGKKKYILLEKLLKVLNDICKL